MALAHLRCEHLEAPLGLDERKPRFSWVIADPRRGAVQSAYQIVVSEAAADGGSRDVWDSGRTASRETVDLEYSGAALESFRRYAWKVRTWDGGGRESPWSEPAAFGTAALAPDEWRADWIGDPVPAPPAHRANNGFHSTFASSEDVQKWVQIDFGQQTVFDEIRLYPARPYDAPDEPGFLFPRRLKVWIDDDPRFEKTYSRIVERSDDIPNPGTEPLVIPITTTRYKVRYVRLGVTKLAEAEGRGFAFALSELELRSAGELVSHGMKATAGDSIEDGGWSAEHLTDGDTVSHGPSGFDALPAPIVRKEFTVGSPVARATLFASALGLFEVRMNGRRVGEDELAPGWTDYGVRVPYLAYDVTDLVRHGRNALAAQLADGWYAGRLGLSWLVPAGPPRGMYGRRPRFLAQLVIEKKDGSREILATDESWRSTIRGPVRNTDLLDGEFYDASAEMPGFDAPGFDDSLWTPVEVSSDLHPRLELLACEPTRVVETRKPVSIRETAPGVYVYDLGQNMVGRCRLRLTAPAGTEIVLRHAEMAQPDGSIYTENLRSAAQTDRYLSRGGGEELFEPRFTFHGFRYVEVSGLPAKPALEDLEGRVVGTAFERVGSFQASDPILERLWANIDWSLRGNTISIPTDCPQRDERLGWTGDIAAFAGTAACQRDVASFLAKWISDLRDAQAPDGRYPDFAPHPYGLEERCTGTPAWGDAGVLVPWAAWVHYRDRRLVSEHLDSMIRWLEWIRSRNQDLVWRNDRGSDYRDWLNGDTLVREGWPKTGAATPGEVLATAFFARSARLVSRMAEGVGRAEEARRFEELFQGIREAFRKAFVAEDGRIEGDSQGACALALAFDLLSEEQQAKAFARLVESIEKDYGGHLSTGFTSTLPAMLELSRRGRADLATKLALQRSFPSWGYAIDQGATTIWERWDGFVPERGLQDAGMNSFNHYAFGAVGEWMMRTLAGIEPDEEHPGWERFTIRPRAGPQLSSVRAEHRTIRGKIASAWSREGGRFELEVTVPANTSARVYLPGGDAAKITEGGRPLAEAAPHVRLAGAEEDEAVLEVDAGTYHFAVER